MHIYLYNIYIATMVLEADRTDEDSFLEAESCARKAFSKPQAFNQQPKQVQLRAWVSVLRLS